MTDAQFDTLIDTTKPWIEISRQQENGAWKFETVDDLAAQLFIASVGISIPLAEIYRNVKFPQETAAGEESRLMEVANSVRPQLFSATRNNSDPARGLMEL